VTQPDHVTAEPANGNFSVSWKGIPAIVLTALVTALGTWQATLHTTPSAPAGDEALRIARECAQSTREISGKFDQVVAENRMFRTWAEQQISILLVRTDPALSRPR
jgi:hypothetical protein